MREDIIVRSKKRRIMRSCILHVAEGYRMSHPRMKAKAWNLSGQASASRATSGWSCTSVDIAHTCCKVTSPASLTQASTASAPAPRTSSAGWQWASNSAGIQATRVVWRPTQGPSAYFPSRMELCMSATTHGWRLTTTTILVRHDGPIAHQYVYLLGSELTTLKELVNKVCSKQAYSTAPRCIQ